MHIVYIVELLGFPFGTYMNSLEQPHSLHERCRCSPASSSDVPPRIFFFVCDVQLSAKIQNEIDLLIVISTSYQQQDTFHYCLSVYICKYV